MYAITLKKDQTLEIDGLVPAGKSLSGEGDPAKISFTCGNRFEATPTPTEFTCIPDSFVSVPITGDIVSQNIGGRNTTFMAFPKNNSKVGIDASFLVDGSQPGLTVPVTIPGFTTATIILTNKEPQEEGGQLYLHIDDACYGGPWTQADAGWKVDMTLIKGIAPEPTPTPQAPTPTPQSLDCSCSSFDSYVSEGPAGNPLGTNVDQIGFAKGTEISYDPSTFTSDGASIAHNVEFKLPDGEFIGMLVIQQVKPNNTPFYVRRGSTCWVARATPGNANGNNWSLNMTVEKTLSSECDDGGVVEPTPTPVEPTPTPVEPTPTPVQPTECCPSTTTEFDTFGGTEPTLHEIDEFNTGKPVGVLSYQGFDSGGKLCVNMSFESPMEVDAQALQVLLAKPESPSSPFAAVNKFLQNGNDIIFYTDSQQNCYTADLSSEDDVIVMTRVN